MLRILQLYPPLLKSKKRSASDRPQQWQKIQATFSAFHSVKTDIYFSAANTLMVTHTNTCTSCLMQILQLGLHQGAMSNHSVVPGGSLEGTSRLMCQPQSTQAKWCVTPAWKRVGRCSGETWAALFWNGHRGTENIRRDRQGKAWMPLTR